MFQIVTDILHYSQPSPSPPRPPFFLLYITTKPFFQIEATPFIVPSPFCIVVSL